MANRKVTPDRASRSLAWIPGSFAWIPRSLAWIHRVKYPPCAVACRQRPNHASCILFHRHSCRWSDAGFLQGFSSFLTLYTLSLWVEVCAQLPTVATGKSALRRWSMCGFRDTGHLYPSGNPHIQPTGSYTKGLGRSRMTRGNRHHQKHCCLMPAIFSRST